MTARIAETTARLISSRRRRVWRTGGASARHRRTSALTRARSGRAAASRLRRRARADASAASGAGAVARSWVLSIARRLLGRAQGVADAAHGVDHPRQAGGVYLVAQVVDIGVEDVAAGLRAFGPDAIGELGAREDAVGVAGEVFEQGEFTGGKRDASPGARDFVAGYVHDEVAGADLAGLGARLELPAAADEGAQAGEQLLEGERLGEVVVGAGVEAGDLVLGGVERGEQEDGCGDALATQRAADADAVAAREEDVEHDDVEAVVVGPHERVGGVAVAQHLHLVPLVLKVALVAARQARLVFDQEDAHTPPAFIPALMLLLLWNVIALHRIMRRLAIS